MHVLLYIILHAIHLIIHVILLDVVLQHSPNRVLDSLFEIFTIDAVTDVV